MRDRIYITDADYEKLRRLVAGGRLANSGDREYLEMLEEEFKSINFIDSSCFIYKKYFVSKL